MYVGTGTGLGSLPTGCWSVPLVFQKLLGTLLTTAHSTAPLRYFTVGVWVIAMGGGEAGPYCEYVPARLS